MELLRAETVIDTEMPFVFTCSRTLGHLAAGGRIRVLAEQPFILSFKRGKVKRSILHLTLC